MSGEEGRSADRYTESTEGGWRQVQVILRTTPRLTLLLLHSHAETRLIFAAR